jgi:peptide/nickel transport system permease protein
MSMGKRSVLRQLSDSAPGRLGLSLLAVLTLASLYVVVTYPLDFGPSRWSNPAVWSDNPSAVPPRWINWFSREPGPVHQVIETSESTTVSAFGPGESRIFELPFHHDSAVAPTFLSLTLGEIRYSARPPQYVVALVRPDGLRIPLTREVVSGPRSGESGPYIRYAETPKRLLLSSRRDLPAAIADSVYSVYPMVGVAAFVKAVESRPLGGLFGVPNADGSIDSLTGRYVLEARFTVADPGDVVSSVRGVAGGAAFGLVGTDALGRDLAEGLLFGLPIALLIGVLASTLSTLIGTVLGLVSGFVGGRTDLVIQRVADVMNNVPALPLLIFLVFILGSRLWLILAILVVFSWPGLTILVRSMVLPLRNSPEVEAARTLGASTAHILRHHVFPHTAPFVLAQLIFFAPGAILAEAGLSFLGLGDPSLPTWGQILEQGFRTGAVFLGYWWWIVPPGLLIVLTAVTFMLLALGMETVVNPRLREQ